MDSILYLETPPDAGTNTMINVHRPRSQSLRLKSFTKKKLVRRRYEILPEKYKLFRNKKFTHGNN
jgi:hypothetical protein